MLIRSFCYDLTAAQAAKATGLSRRQVIMMYGRIRQRVADHCQEAKAKMQATDEWESMLQEYWLSSQAALIVKRLGFGKAKGLDIVRIEQFEEGDPRLLAIRQEIQQAPDEWIAKVNSERNRYLNAKFEMYHIYRVVRARGILNSNKNLFRDESSLRFMCLILSLRGFSISENRTYKSSDRSVSFYFLEGIFTSIFREERKSYRIFYKMVLNIINNHPLD